MANLLFVAPCINDGGAERVMVLLANELAARNNKVFFLLTKSNVVKYKPNYDVTVLLNEGKVNAVGQIKSIKKAIKHYKIDFCISFIPYQSFICLFSTLFSKTKVIVSERNDPKHTFSIRFFNFVRSLLYPLAKWIVFQTPDAMNCFRGAIRKKGVVIPNPISNNLPVWSGVESKTFIAASRLHPQKNLPFLINSFSEFHKTFPDYKLDIYGDGEERNNLEQLINDLNLNGVVSLKGRSDSIFDVMRDSFCFVLSSNFEGMPNSLIEAMAIGMPCISTDCRIGAPKMLISNKINGLLVPVGDSNFMVESLSWIASQDKNNLNEISRNASKIKKLLNTETIVSQWEYLFSHDRRN